MLDHHVKLVGAQRTALTQNGLRYPRFAHIVQGRAPAQGFERFVVQAIGLAEPGGVRHHPQHMLPLHRVQGGAQALDGLLQGFLGAAQALTALVSEFGGGAGKFEAASGALILTLPDDPHPPRHPRAANRGFLAHAALGIQAPGMAADRQLQELVERTAQHLFGQQARHVLPVAAETHHQTRLIKQKQR